MLVLEEKFLERRWWKYGAALAALFIVLWVLMGKKYDPDISIWLMFSRSYVVVATFAVAAFLPFAAGRLGSKVLFGFGLAGFLIAGAVYFILALFPPTRQVVLLPFVAFVQFFVAFFGIGLVIEFGRYVYRKLTG